MAKSNLERKPDGTKRDTAPGTPGRGAKFFQVGMLFSRQGQPKRALTAFKRALELEPDEPRYLSFYGLTLVSYGERRREGLRLCKLAVKREVYSPELHLNLGKVLALTGRRARAREVFLQGLALDPQNSEIGQALQGMGVGKPLAFPFLNRKNPINKWVAWLRHRVLPQSRTPSAV